MRARTAVRALSVAVGFSLFSLPALSARAAWVVKAPNQLGALVDRWTPAKGPPARYLADLYRTFDCGAYAGLSGDDTPFSGLLVVLGEEPGGAVWSARSAFVDAIDEGCPLELTRMTPDGRTTVRSIVSIDDWQALAQNGSLEQEHPRTLAAVHQRALERLWKSWPTVKLEPAGRVLRTTYDSKLFVDDSAYPGWMVQAYGRQALFEFNLVRKDEMCWTFPEWHASVRPLPAPAPR